MHTNKNEGEAGLADKINPLNSELFSCAIIFVVLIFFKEEIDFFHIFFLVQITVIL